MQYTKYGKALATKEPVPTFEGTMGASAHMQACQHDTGTLILLTGTDYSGRPFRKHAHSSYGAFAMVQALPTIANAWHIRPGQGRKLLFRN